MKSYLLGSIVLVLLITAGCAKNGTPSDGNAVQVDGADSGIAPRAEIPSDFVSAVDALAEGSRLFDAGETLKAIDVLLQAVKLDPDLAEAYFKLGIAYSLVEDEDQSVEGPVASGTQEARNKKPVEKKKNSEKAFESAVDGYKKLIAKNKDDDNAHFYLGLAYNKLNQDEDAAKSLREAVRLKPDNTEYQTKLGSILIKLAKYHEAVPALKKALELDPGNIDAEELLEKAEAGRKRIDFVTVKKDDKKTDANSNVSSNSKPGNDANSNKPAAPPTMKSTKPPPPLPVKSPK